jgi:DNA-binding NarL/FixJ family response regulator
LNAQSSKKATGSAVGSPFSFLDGMLNLLVIENDPGDREQLATLLKTLPCYSVTIASDNSSAIDALRSGKRMHACITDLGMDDIGGDEFYVLRQYAHHCSMIVLSGCRSPQKGAASVQFGARAVFDKGASFQSSSLIRTLNELTLINIVNHRYAESSGDTFNLATKILIKTNPQSVTEWAENMRITDRQLRNLWHTGSGFGAKHILFLYHCCKSTFRYYEERLFNIPKESRFTPPFSAKRLAAYFENHRKILTYLLS